MQFVVKKKLSTATSSVWQSHSRGVFATLSFEHELLVITGENSVTHIFHSLTTAVEHYIYIYIFLTKYDILY